MELSVIINIVTIGICIANLVVVFATISARKKADKFRREIDDDSRD